MASECAPFTAWAACSCEGLTKMHAFRCMLSSYSSASSLLWPHAGTMFPDLAWIAYTMNAPVHMCTWCHLINLLSRHCSQMHHFRHYARVATAS